MTNLPGRRLLTAAIIAFAGLVAVALPAANAANAPQRGSVYLMRGFANVDAHLPARKGVFSARMVLTRCDARGEDGERRQ